MNNGILEREFKKVHPKENGYLAVGDVWQSHAWSDRDSSTARMTAAWRAAKKAFHDSFVWL